MTSTAELETQFDDALKGLHYGTDNERTILQNLFYTIEGLKKEIEILKTENAKVAKLDELTTQLKVQQNALVVQNEKNKSMCERITKYLAEEKTLVEKLRSDNNESITGGFDMSELYADEQSFAAPQDLAGIAFTGGEKDRSDGLETLSDKFYYFSDMEGGDDDESNESYESDESDSSSSSSN
jgi:hypothetical protein